MALHAMYTQAHNMKTKYLNFTKRNQIRNT